MPDIDNVETLVIAHYNNRDNAMDEFVRANEFLVKLNAKSNYNDTHTSDHAENNFDRELVDENFHKSTQDTNLENSEGVTDITTVAPETS